MSVVDAASTVVERIAVVIEARLQAGVADLARQRYFNRVHRPTRLRDYSPRDRLIVVEQSDEDEEVGELMKPGNPPSIAFATLFMVRCYVMPSEKDPTPFDTYCNQVAGDVTELICRSGTGWHTFDSNAFDAEWLTRIKFAPGDDDGRTGEGVVVPLLVYYRVSERSPYIKRS